MLLWFIDYIIGMNKQETNNTKGATMTYNTCPACGSKLSRSTDHGLQIYECVKCGAIYGNCYLGDSYGIVKPFFGEDGEQSIYFDLTCLGSEGITRRHGWYNPETLLITQTG